MVTEFLLIRHAVNDFVKTGKLAGWTAGVHLNPEGQAQAEALGRRLAETRLDAIYSSPLERTLETAQAIIAHHPHLQIQTLDSIGEVHFGAWQGAELRHLSRSKRWFMVQALPSRTQFPDGETIRQAQLRTIDAIETLVERYPRQRVALVSHSDIIKLVVAYYIGAHLDMFQRINISPASLTTIHLGYGRVMIGQVNETSYLPKPPRSDGSQTDVRDVQGIAVGATGQPGQRTFYLQVQPADAPMITLDFEKAQALRLADEVERLFAGDIPHTAISSAAPLQIPETSLFRAGPFTFTYQPEQDVVLMEITELIGHDQGQPRSLHVWASREQILTLGEQARQVAHQGRPD